MDPIYLVLTAAVDVVHNLDDPMVLIITNSRVTVTRNFMVQLGDGGRNRVRVEVPCGRCVLKTDDIAVLEVADKTLRIVHRLVPARQDVPLVVLILVVITGDLLLLGAHRIRLDVGV